MFFELQLSAGVFTRIVRNRLKSLPLCVDREFTDEEGNFLVVDQVIIGENTWIQREQKIDLVNGVPTATDVATQTVWIFSPFNYSSIMVPYLQVKQEVFIRLVKSSDLDANGANPTPPFKTLTIYPVFNVALQAANQTQGGGPLSLSYSLAYINFGFLGLVASAAQLAQIQQFVAGIQLPPTTVNLTPLTAMLERPVSAINAGIACDPNGNFVALRVDFDVYASPVSLGRDFFEAGPANRLGGRDWAMLIDANILTQDARKKAKGALEGDPKIRLNSGPDVSWDPGSVSIDIHAAVELVDACPFFIDDIDMDADVDIRISISVPATNTLRRHFHLKGEPSNVVEEIGCALTGALLWPFIGPLLLKDEDLGIGLGAYIGGLAVGPLFTFIGIIAAIESKGVSKDLSKKLGSNCTKQDDENYECNDVLDLTMALSPGSNSRLELESVVGVPEGLVLSGTVSNLRDFFLGSLEPVHVKPFTWQILGRCTGNGKNNFSIGNQAKISVFGTPPAGMCKAYVLSDPEGEFILTYTESEVIIAPRFKPGYSANPYPCRVRIITNRGVRTITLPPPLAMTDAESRELETARLRAIASCYYWEKIFTPIEKIRWIPDPPFDDRPFIQFWQIVVRGLQPEESIRVEGKDGTTVLTAKPSRARLVHFSLLFPGDQAPAELTMELNGRIQENNEVVRELSIQQVQFEHRATLPVRGPVKTMRFEGANRDRRLIITDKMQEISWNLAVPLAPFLLSSSVLSEVKETSQFVVQNGKRMVYYSIPNMRRAMDYLQDRFGWPEAVGSPRVGGIGETLYLRNGDRATLFDISQPSEPREIQRYERGAWFEGVAMSGKLLARHNADAGTVEVYYATVSQTL